MFPFLFLESSRAKRVRLKNDPEKYPLVNPGEPTERTGIAPDKQAGVRDHPIGSMQWKASQRTRWRPEMPGRRHLPAGHSLCHRRTPKAAFRRRAGEPVGILGSMGVQLPPQRQQDGAGQKDRGQQD